MVREAENTVREESNLPRVGEGWISETELYHTIRDLFISEIVIPHGRPMWLAPQHLDIYFPEREIGLEYQGAQHSRPVNYFGGETAYNKQKARDRRKEKLCEKNGCLPHSYLRRL